MELVDHKLEKGFLMRNYTQQIFVTLLVSLLTLWVLDSVKEGADYEIESIQNKVSVEVVREDGSVEYYEGDRFPCLNKGDQLIVDVPIPDDLEIRDPALYFKFYHSVTRVSFDGEELYAYGEDLDAKGEQIGKIYASVAIPKEAYGKSMQIACIATENHAMNQLADLLIMSMTDSGKFNVVHKLQEAVFYVVLAMASFIVLLFTLMVNVKKKAPRMVFWIALFLFILSVFVLSHEGIYCCLTNNVRTSGILENITFFLLPIPLNLFFYELESKRNVRSLLKSFIIIQLLFFVVVSVLNFTTANYHFHNYLFIQYIFMGISVVFDCIISFRDHANSKTKDWQTFIRAGITVFLIVGVLEFLKFYLERRLMEDLYLSHINFLFLGTIALTISLLMSGYSYVYSAYHERRNLERLAYADELTGLMNRTKCFSYMDDMKRQNKQEFSLFFMDLNNLKVVNDTCGHECGDAYIKAAALAIQKTFTSCDIASRIGGDEFVVIYNHKMDENVQELLEKLKKEFAMVCKVNKFPFFASIACGFVVSTSKAPFDVEKALKRADAQMYVDKEKIKSERKSQSSLNRLE